MENVITFYYAIGSRYSYLASTQINELAERHGCTVNWMPVEGFELRALSSSDPFRGKTLPGQYKSPFRENDILAWANYYAIPYREPPALKDGELWWTNYDFRPLSRAAVAGLLLGHTAEVSKLLFAQMFASNTWPIDELTCIDAVVKAEIEREVFIQTLARNDIDEILTESARRAADSGVFGVPSFLIDDKLFFGNDRLVLLDHYLRTRESS